MISSPATPTPRIPSHSKPFPSPSPSTSVSTSTFTLSKPRDSQSTLLSRRFPSKASQLLSRRQSKPKSSTSDQLRPQPQRRGSLIKSAPITPPDSGFHCWEYQPGSRTLLSAESMIPRSEEVLSPTIISTSSKDPRSPSAFPRNYNSAPLLPLSPESSEEEGTSVSEGTDEEDEESEGTDQTDLKDIAFNPERRRSSAATAVPSSHHRHRHSQPSNNSVSSKKLLTPWEMQDGPWTLTNNGLENAKRESSEIGTEEEGRDWISNSKDPTRRRSNQSLRLDLEGLDLGARPEEEKGTNFSPGYFATSPSIPKDRQGQQLRTGATSISERSLSTSRPQNKLKKSFNKSQASQVSSPPESSVSSLIARSPARSNKPPDKRFKELDSFTAHLREQCVESREIMGMGEESKNQNLFGEGSAGSANGKSVGSNSPISPESGLNHPLNSSKPGSPESENHPQLLGGFASLGIAPWAGVLAAKENMHNPPGDSAPGTIFWSPSRPATPRSDQIRTSSSSWSGVGLGLSSDSSDSNIKAGELSSTSTHWGKLLASNRDPMEMFEIVSIEEMGQHSIDVGSAEDWEGWSLRLDNSYTVAAEATSTLESEKLSEMGPKRMDVGWEVARSMKRQKKWIVAPSEALKEDSAWGHDSPSLDSSIMFPEQASSKDSSSAPQIARESACSASETAALRTIVISDHQSSRREADGGSSLFSGQSQFELRFLRAGHGSPDRPFILAGPQVHRDSVGTPDSRSRLAGSVSSPAVSGSGLIKHSLDQAGSGRPPAQLDDKRGTLTSSTDASVRQLRKTRSRPALRGPASRSRADDYAPSLPGRSNERGISDGVTWPSARRGSDLPQLRGATPSAVDLESRRPSLGKSNSHESLGVTTPKPTTTAALATAGVKGNRQSLPPTVLLASSGSTEEASTSQSSDAEKNSHKLSLDPTVDSPPSLGPPGLSTFSSYSIPSSSLPSEGKSPFEDYTLFMDPPQRSHTNSDVGFEPSPRSSTQLPRTGQTDPLDPASSHLPVEWSIEPSRAFPNLSRVETSPAATNRSREIRLSSSASSGLQDSSPSNLAGSNSSKSKNLAPASSSGFGASNISNKKEKRLSDWFKKKVLSSPTVRPISGLNGGFQSPFAYSISTLEGEFELESSEVLKSPNKDSPSWLEINRFSRRPDTAPESPSSGPESFAELQRAQWRGPQDFEQKTAKLRTLSSHKNREEEIAGMNGKRGRKRMNPSENQTSDKSDASNQGEKSSKKNINRESLHEDERAVLSAIGKMHAWENESSPIALNKNSKPSGSRPSKNSIIASTEGSRALIQQQAEKSREISRWDEAAQLDLDLLGLEGVSEQALTMLLPLPLFPLSHEAFEQGKPRRYLRISFLPFAASTSSLEGGINASNPVPSNQNQDSSAPFKSHHDQHQHPLSNAGTAHGFGLVRKFALAARELSSSSNSTSNSNCNSGSGSSGNASQNNTQLHNHAHAIDGQFNNRKDKKGRETVNPNLEWDRCRLPTRRKSCIEAFRITAMVLDSPFFPEVSRPPPVDTRSINALPETTSFPLVLGICDCERGLELVPEGWEALGLNQSRSIQRQDPMAGIADLIIAASVAVMDL